MQKKIETKIKDQALIEKKRRIIIEAGGKLFVKKGFHKTTISEIAKESGLTPGTLYNYIREKEDILFLMHEYYQKKFLKQMNLAIQQGTNIQSRTENVFNTLLELVNKHQKELRLIYIEAASQTKISLEVLLNRESEIIKNIRDLIAIGVKQNVFEVRNQRLAASIIHFLIFYQSLNTWDIKKMGMPNSDIKRYVISCIYRILGYNGPVSAD